MPPQKRAAARGRRDPSLLEGDQIAEQAYDGPTEEFDEQAESEFASNVQILSEGDHIRVSVSIPVTLGEMDRYSIIQAEAQAHVQDDEPTEATVQRALDATRLAFFTTVDQFEDDLRAYAEQKAAEAARVDRQVRTGR